MSQQRTDPPTFTLIVNPIAGNGRCDPLALARALASRLPGAELLITERRGHARELAASHCARDDHVVVAIGGDGTVHEVGSGLIGGRAALAVLPAGSGNDFAKMLGISDHPDEAAGLLQTLLPSSCDVGQVLIDHLDGSNSSSYFLNGLGIGFEAAVASMAARAGYLRGFSRYLVAALWTLMVYRSPEMTLMVDKQTFAGRHFLVAIGNGRCAGGSFYLTPQAEIDDGLFDICRAGPISIPRALWILPSVFKGRHGRYREVVFDRAAAVTIDIPDGGMVHADGEVLARQAAHLDVSLLPGALKVVRRGGWP